MANKSAVPRVSKFQPNISGMDGQHMHNEILLGLRRAESVALFPYLEYVPMPTHHVLHEAGQTITHGHFINSGLASVLNLMKDGKSVEVGLAGKEGFIGLPLIVGLSTSPTRVVAHVGGKRVQNQSFRFETGAAPMSKIAARTQSLCADDGDASHVGCGM
jgi:CRP-like cAMP-binding protein